MRFFVTDRASLGVLVADDNRDAADALATLLEIEGHRARAVYDGRTALEAGAAMRPEVVLLDLGMPDLDGYETARLLRASDWGERVTLVALTGFGQDSDRERTRETGFDHHLVKPVDIEELLSLLAAV